MDVWYDGMQEMDTTSVIYYSNVLGRRESMKNKGVVIGGITLILVGIALLVQTLLPYTWPLIAICVGVAFLSAAASYRLCALAIPGTSLL